MKRFFDGPGERCAVSVLAGGLRATTFQSEIVAGEKVSVPRLFIF